MENSQTFVIAVDGPAGSGKSTVAAAVADRLNATLFDTGAVYRALTLASIELGIDPADGESLASLARDLPLRVGPPSKRDGRQYDVWLGQRDITWAIRGPSVERSVSMVSAHAAVRDALLELQRDIGRSGRVVMSGRDVGTVVMPDAELKIWLDASLDERSRRRHKQLSEQGICRPLNEIRAEIQARDCYDGSRAAAPMARAPDAVVIHTDGLSAPDVVTRILILSEERGFD